MLKKRNISLTTTLALLALMLIPAASIRADVLASWDMETSPNAARQAASFVDSRVTTTDLTPQSTLNAAGSFDPSNDPVAGNTYIAYSRNVGPGDMLTALDAKLAGTYFEFTVTPAAGPITVTGISMDVMAGTGGPSDRQFYLYSDKSGYLTSEVLDSASTESGSAPFIPYNTANYAQNFATDLAGNSAFENIADSVTFRIFIGTPGTYQNVGFDNITIEGIPEPATFSLFGLAGIAVMAVRRIKR